MAQERAMKDWAEMKWTTETWISLVAFIALFLLLVGPEILLFAGLIWCNMSAALFGTSPRCW